MDNSFDRLRKLAGVVTPANTTKTKKILKEDVVPGMGPTIKRGGKHLFYLVTNATPDSTLGDVISEVDLMALLHIAVGAAHGNARDIVNVAQKEQWEVFPHDKQKDALALANKRMEKAKSGEESEEETVKVSPKALHALEHIIDKLDNAAVKQSQLSIKALLMKDAAAYHEIKTLLTKGKFDEAKKLFGKIDTAAREYISTENVPSRATREELANLLGFTLNLKEDSMSNVDTQPYSSSGVKNDGVDITSKEDDTMKSDVGELPPVKKDDEEDKEASGLTVLCPVCKKEMAYEEFPTHAEECKDDGRDEEPPVEGDEPRKEKEPEVTMDISMGEKPPMKEAAELPLTDTDKQMKDLGHERSADMSMPAKDHEATVTVPASVMSSLKKKIKDAKDEAEKYKGRDDAVEGFNLTLADALETLLKHLEKGTVHCLKMAQVDMTKLMSPLLHEIPNDVLEFITHGGEPKSLKDRFMKLKNKDNA